jgi:hypothetical protein
MRITMGRRFVSFAAFAIVVLFIVVTLQAQQTKNISGCVQCHTSDSALKALNKPPKITVSEGEG